MRKYTLVDMATGEEIEADADTVVRWSRDQGRRAGGALGARFCRALRHCAPVDHLPDHLWRPDRLAGGHGAVKKKAAIVGSRATMRTKRTFEFIAATGSCRPFPPFDHGEGNVGLACKGRRQVATITSFVRLS